MKTFFFFFLESTCALCPWSLALASSIPVLGLESVCPRKGCPWPWPWPRIFFVSLALALASSLVSSTPPLRIRSAWKKFKEVSNVICGRSISLKVRGTLYKTYMRYALTYGAECWALNIENERRLKTTEMRMLRMICEKTLKDKTNNEKIREMTGVVRFEEFLREKRLRWLGHVERMDEERGPVKALLLEVDGTKKGRPKKRWKEVLECDMTATGLQRLDAQDRERWRLGCKNQLTPACGEPLLSSRNRRKHIPWAKWWRWWKVFCVVALCYRLQIRLDINLPYIVTKHQSWALAAHLYILLAIALLPQLFLNCCDGACAASILAILSASAIQIQL